ncbi:hypothetical protein ACZ90_10185 [Streptomyces albus subsp. albus]|nr:hypothetical protein ACZ90_10185 [Streptomyces albus subsp. albus]
MPRISVDGGRCVGSGNCVRIAPELFDQGEDGRARLRTDADRPPWDADASQAREAAELCPAAAIGWSPE